MTTNTQQPEYDSIFLEEDDDGFSEPECERCRGDGRDPWTDYLMTCPQCQGVQQ